MRKTNSHIMSLILKTSIKHKFLNGACKLHLKTTRRNRSASLNNILVLVNFCLKKKTFTFVVKAKHIL